MGSIQLQTGFCSAGLPLVFNEVPGILGSHPVRELQILDGFVASGSHSDKPAINLVPTNTLWSCAPRTPFHTLAQQGISWADQAAVLMRGAAVMTGPSLRLGQTLEQRLEQKIRFQLVVDSMKTAFEDLYSRGRLATYNKHGLQFEYVKVRREDAPLLVHMGSMGLRFGPSLFVVDDFLPGLSFEDNEMVMDMVAVHEFGEMAFNDHNRASLLEFAIAQREGVLGRYLELLKSKYQLKFRDVSINRMMEYLEGATENTDDVVDEPDVASDTDKGARDSIALATQYADSFVWPRELYRRFHTALDDPDSKIEEKKFEEYAKRMTCNEQLKHFLDHATNQVLQSIRNLPFDVEPLDCYRVAQNAFYRMLVPMESELDEGVLDIRMADAGMLTQTLGEIGEQIAQAISQKTRNSFEHPVRKVFWERSLAEHLKILKAQKRFLEHVHHFAINGLPREAHYTVLAGAWNAWKMTEPHPFGRLEGLLTKLADRRMDIMNALSGMRELTEKLNGVSQEEQAELVQILVARQLIDLRKKFSNLTWGDLGFVAQLICLGAVAGGGVRAFERCCVCLPDWMSIKTDVDSTLQQWGGRGSVEKKIVIKRYSLAQKDEDRQTALEQVSTVYFSAGETGVQELERDLGVGVVSRALAIELLVRKCRKSGPRLIPKLWLIPVFAKKFELTPKDIAGLVKMVLDSELAIPALMSYPSLRDLSAEVMRLYAHYLRTDVDCRAVVEWAWERLPDVKAGATENLAPLSEGLDHFANDHARSPCASVTAVFSTTDIWMWSLATNRLDLQREEQRFETSQLDPEDAQVIAMARTVCDGISFDNRGRPSHPDVLFGDGTFAALASLWNRPHLHQDLSFLVNAFGKTRQMSVGQDEQILFDDVVRYWLISKYYLKKQGQGCEYLGRVLEMEGRGLDVYAACEDNALAKMGLMVRDKRYELWEDFSHDDKNNFLAGIFSWHELMEYVVQHEFPVDVVGRYLQAEALKDKLACVEKYHEEAGKKWIRYGTIILKHNPDQFTEYAQALHSCYLDAALPTAVPEFILAVMNSEMPADDAVRFFGLVDERLQNDPDLWLATARHVRRFVREYPHRCYNILYYLFNRSRKSFVKWSINDLVCLCRLYSFFALATPLGNEPHGHLRVLVMDELSSRKSSPKPRQIMEEAILRAAKELGLRTKADRLDFWYSLGWARGT
ncbi:MAG: hypothetical protein ACD_62C00402G0005 [uncultured bacterium]|nr:MAG: hypothetical protein ACD_62C00402G0005 [uncultured bacterium]HLD45948.1 hypothetical protein [bacterium]